MTEVPDWILSVDPGGQTTGIMLARLNQGVLTPVDGLTFRRLETESDTSHTGTPKYVRRLLSDAIWCLLDKHGVGDDNVLVCVETVVVPKPMPGSKGHVVPMAVWRDLFGTCAVLGAITAIWPDSTLVAPNGHDKKKGIYPGVLEGRRPKSWMSTGSPGERQHQRAAWSIMLVGLRQAGVAFTVAEDDAPMVRVDAGDLAAVVTAIRARLKSEKSSLALLIDTTFVTRPALSGDALVDTALAAAESIKRSKDPAALRVRLAASLNSLSADSLVCPPELEKGTPCPRLDSRAGIAG